MGAMRRYTKQELEEELTNEWGLTKTEHVSGTHTFWKTPGGNYVPFITMEDDQRYPDHLLDELLRQVEQIDSA